MARRLKGEGSLYQTKDKTWVCQYYGDDGKRHTKRFQRKVDGAVVSRPRFVDRPDGIHRLAELREQLSNLQKR